jgi:hypothetical protein
MGMPVFKTCGTPKSNGNTFEGAIVGYTDTPQQYECRIFSLETRRSVKN